MLWHTEKRKLSELKVMGGNPRKASAKQTADLAASLTKFDIVDPLIINSDNTIIGGHLRNMVLRNEMDKDNSELEVDVRVPDRMLTEEEVKELNIRLNFNTGSWDEDLLANFDEDLLKMVGWESEDLDRILQFEPSEEDDEVPEARQETDIRLGDIFQLGEHRLMCGDSTIKEDVERLMGGDKADMVFTDPPYGNLIITNKKGEVGNSNVVKVKQYHKYTNEGDFDFAPVWEIIKEWDCKKLVWGGNYFPFLPVVISWIVWDKRAGERSWFSDCELAWTNFGMKAKIYAYVWQGMIREGEKEERVHPTQKPVQLMGKLMGEYGKRDNIVLDLFGGSGTTLIACEKLNRKCRMMEIDPIYCQVIIDRWEKFTTQKAVKLN